jgi:hypothetical protein
MSSRTIHVLILTALFIGSLGRLAAPAGADCPDPGTVILPGLAGTVLQDSLRARYRPPIRLTYATARDVEYSRIDNHDSTLVGIYSGYAVHVAPDSATARAEALSKDINAEHTWPQSKGADQLPAKADMNQLRPSRMEVNAARANYPFAEIPDEDVDTWYRLSQVTTTPDPAHLDEYSELDVNASLPYGGRWEPRESVKGDIARGMFYFYTVYRAEADAADPNYFGVMKDDLRAWTKADPADSAEYARACAIASYQDGKFNPFVIDPTLVDRAYFPNTPVRIASFTATPWQGGVRLDWRTKSESDHAGFNVLRARGETEVRLNAALLGPGPLYTFTDRTGRAGTVYAYAIEAVGRDGSRQRFGPRDVRFPEPELRIGPNPARVGEAVGLMSAGSEPVAVDLYDLSGRHLRGWDAVPAGQWHWDGRLASGRAVSPGIYFLRIRTPEREAALRVVLIG